MAYKVKDISLKDAGKKKIEWAEAHMPVLIALKEEYEKEQPLKGLKIAGAIHVTKEVAVLLRTLTALGASVAWAGCNPLSTQDDVAAALADEGIEVYAWRNNHDEYYWCIDQIIATKPNLTMDDGGDVVFRLHTDFPQMMTDVIGGTEETTTGVHRLKAMAKDGKLKYPIIAVNNAETKWDFDNIYGTGQGTIDGILRSTSVLLAGKNFVIAGYGHCGKGLAMRAKGMGSHVIVTEVDPIQALKARMEGFDVMQMDEAVKIGDIFVTATGCKDVIVEKHFKHLKEGAVLSNTGHFNVEVDVKALEKHAKSKEEIRDNCMKYVLPNGKNVYLLAEGRLVNLSAAEGHPSEVMDLSFANQVLALLQIVKFHKDMKPEVYEIPAEQDQRIAMLKLKSMDVNLDSLTEEQKKYLGSYAEGT
ncbi:MAG: adenosylhomocysteinase [Nanoarchaeota archaeon]|nr:adenosylhomocysteinase [Nanoarchaeota archaeon]